MFSNYYSSTEKSVLFLFCAKKHLNQHIPYNAGDVLMRWFCVDCYKAIAG